MKPETTIDFLQNFHSPNDEKGQPWHLLFIDPRGGPPTGEFAMPGEIGAQEQTASDFINDHPECNFYFTVGIPHTYDNGAKKTSKDDMASWGYVWVDVDCGHGEDIEEGKARIKNEIQFAIDESLIPEPTFTNMSGNGYQLFWRLAEPTSDMGRIERTNKWLVSVLGGDKNCWNADRIMRLPGLVNYPDAKKQKRGRLPIMADMVSWNKKEYSLDDFQEVAEAATKKVAPVEVNVGDIQFLKSVEDLDVTDRVKTIIVMGHDPDQPKEDDNSRSAWVFDAACQMVRAEVPDPVIIAVLLDPNFKISESVREQGNPLKYAIKQVASAKKFVAEDEADFDRTDKGVILKSAKNIRLALQKLGLQLSHDDFADRDLVNGDGYLDDDIVRWARIESGERFGLNITKEFFIDVVLDTARRARFHPVRDYFDSLKWDGEKRLDTWLIKYTGAKDTPYMREVCRLVLTAIVRRVRKPGCKFDEMLVLESPKQGTAKSTLIQTLAIREEWYNGNLPLGADPKTVIERTAGCLVAEGKELSGMRKGEVEELKAMLDTQVDIARLAYGRLTERKARQFIIIGTTNSDKYLKDSTGNRRFWPVRIVKIDIDGLKRDIDQLYAEAAAQEASGASIRMDKDLWDIAGQEQEQRRLVNPFTEAFTDVLGDLQGTIETDCLWGILGKHEAGRRSQQDNDRLASAMQELGFEKPTKDGRRTHNGKRKACYSRGTNTVEQENWIEVERDTNGKWSATPDATPSDDGVADLPF